VPCSVADTCAALSPPLATALGVALGAAVFCGAADLAGPGCGTEIVVPLEHAAIPTNAPTTMKIANFDIPSPSARDAGH
jgi:hypothetical protein